MVYSVDFSGDGTRVASGGGDGYVVVWERLKREEAEAEERLKRERQSSGN